MKPDNCTGFYEDGSLAYGKVLVDFEFLERVEDFLDAFAIYYSAVQDGLDEQVNTFPRQEIFKSWEKLADVSLDCQTARARTRSSRTRLPKATDTPTTQV
jgi:hypothetical protein